MIGRQVSFLPWVIAMNDGRVYSSSEFRGTTGGQVSFFPSVAFLIGWENEAGFFLHSGLRKDLQENCFFFPLNSRNDYLAGIFLLHG